MAKVTGPLMSVDARGKIANALVFMGWKGLNTVRQWVVPANPRTGLQGDMRLIFGGLGRATRVIVGTSAYAIDARAVAGPQQTFVSEFVKFLTANVVPTATAFMNERAAYTVHAHKAAFDSAATTLGLATFDVPYKSLPGVFEGGLQVYLLARYGILRVNDVPGSFNRAPFVKAIEAWVAADVEALVADLT